MKRKNKKLKKILALILSTALMFSLIPSFTVFGANIPPAAPNTKQEDVIKAAADFLEDMDMKDMGDNVKEWLTDNKIEIDPDMRANGTANRKGEITIKGSFVEPLPEGKLEKFKRLAALAALLIHEKTHAHQAPEGGALDTNVESGDWIAGYDVMSECVGPDPLEVEAYYKQIRAFLKWAEQIKEEAMPEGLSENEETALQALNDSKVAWLIAQATRWAKILERHNFEKANKFEDIDPLADKLKEIDDNTELTEAQKLEQKIEIIDDLISELFDEDSFYDRARDLYEEKKGETKTTTTVPAIPGIPAVVELPTGLGALTIEGLPIGVLEAEIEMLTIEIYDFLIPPEPDPGYTIISPVFDVEWNSPCPIPFELTISIEDMGRDDIKIAAFGLERTYVENDWTILDTTVVSEEGLSTLSASSDAATMYAVVMPTPTYSDLPESHWSYLSTERLVSKSVLEPSEEVLPSMQVTRELFVMYLVKALGLELVDFNVPFTDVASDSIYLPYIKTAYYHHLTAGISEGSFGMGEIIPREQSITFLIRALGMEEDALLLTENEILYYLSVYTDMVSNNSSWAYPYLTQGVIIKMVEGYENQTMRGKNLLTHAEVITLIDRIMIYIAYNGN